MEEIALRESVTDSEAHAVHPARGGTIQRHFLQV